MGIVYQMGIIKIVTTESRFWKMINKGWSTFILQRMQQFMYLDLVIIYLRNEVIYVSCYIYHLERLCCSAVCMCRCYSAILMREVDVHLVF